MRFAIERTSTIMFFGHCTDDRLPEGCWYDVDDQGIRRYFWECANLDALVALRDELDEEIVLRRAYWKMPDGSIPMMLEIYDDYRE